MGRNLGTEVTDLGYPWLFEVKQLRFYCDGRLNEMAIAGQPLDATRLGAIVPDAASWFRWADWGRKGIGVAGFFLHGPMRAALLIAGALVTIYILFVTQDHLDWPAIAIFPNLADGVIAVLD